MRILLFGTLALALVVLAGWRYSDHRADRMEMAHLLALQPKVPILFDHAMIASLPEPAQWYFRFTIAQGTPLLPVAKLSMTGLFSLGEKDQPNYMKMQAHQVLAPPHGFVWKMRARSGHLGVSGSDSSGWLRFWIGGIMPVARVGTSKDLSRAAFGRSVAEAVFWAPAALLPGPNFVWDEVDVDTTKVTVRHAGIEHCVKISLAPDGRHLSVSFAR